MGCYTYKDMLSVLPPEKTKDWDGDAGYDSELYEIGADYIIELQKKLRAVEEIIERPDYTNPEGMVRELRSVFSENANGEEQPPSRNKTN